MAQSNHLQPSDSRRSTRRTSSDANLQPQGSGESGYASSANGGRAATRQSGAPATRRSGRGATADASFSPEVNGHQNENSGAESVGMDEEKIEEDAEGQEDGEPEGEPPRTSRGGNKRVVMDSDDDAEGEAEEDKDVEMDERRDGRTSRNGKGRGRPRGKPTLKDESESEEQETRTQRVITTTSHGRTISRPVRYNEGPSSDEEDEDEGQPKVVKRGRGRPRLVQHGNSSRRNSDFVVGDEEYDQEDAGYGERPKRSSRLDQQKREADQKRKQSRSRRNDSYTTRSEPKPRNTRNSQKADASFDAGEQEGDEQSTTEDSDDQQDYDEDDPQTNTGGARQRQLRDKKPVDYYAIPALEIPEKNKGKSKSSFKFGRGSDPFGTLPQNLTGAQWAALYPDKDAPPVDSDDDSVPDFESPRKTNLFSSGAAATAAGFGGAGMLAAGGMDLGTGAPSNLGKLNTAATLADTDPLGIPSTVSFDSVGGLGSHIQQLKEMVSLPLLYPEVFERFNITPPRGVLFHGPPGTGKTLLARALAASCSTDGRKISFFMRKGADCLSKWVGEAERQLRLLFDEAKACQPSIIFFDEIDGLAPVRSSKQEQIHASIVSTLLALMDGMDGRGQVIVIGATNRPDAIDPALRRPGRFDREFYFPLPNLEGRRKILDIHTSGWNPPIEESFKDELAVLTKGYGGADLRALCTEAALNAVQRTYPQIYKTNERLVIKPETIDVTARDFIVSQKNLIPSTSRATSSAAASIPPQLVPLLSDALERAKVALSKVLPDVKKPNVLEEAEWEDEGGGFEKEKMMQAFETLRVFRPRMLICGEPGMGQGYVGAAVLHHLEGFHVQSLDLATLVSDSSRTMEAACVQLFIEAKRHKPSILFIPSLLTWCSTVTDTVKQTIKGLLEGLEPSDPILLLAVVDGSLSDLPSDVRGWFGFLKGNRVVMTSPNADQRRAFFEEVLAGIQRPPNEYPDAMPKRKRILEELPIAPPPPPRVPTPAEILALEQSDQRLLEYLKWKLGPVLSELKKRYKKFTRDLYTAWIQDDMEFREDQIRKKEVPSGIGQQPYHKVDLDSMHIDLYKGNYHTPGQFLEDILRIQHNAEVNAILEQDTDAPVRAGQMVNHTKVMLDQTFDEEFKSNCAKMAERMAEREKDAPIKSKGKGKGKEVVISDVLAAAAAAGEIHYQTRSTKGQGGPSFDGPFEIPDVGAIERHAKRAKRDFEESQNGEEPVAKKARGDDLAQDDDADAEGHIDEEAGALVVVDHQPVASTSTATYSNGMPTNEGAYSNSETPSFSNLLNSYVIATPSATAFLAPGRDPVADVANMEFTNSLDDVDPLHDSTGASNLASLLNGSTSSEPLSNRWATPIPAASEGNAVAGPSGVVRFSEPVQTSGIEGSGDASSQKAVDAGLLSHSAALPNGDSLSGPSSSSLVVEAPAPIPSSPIHVDPPTPEPLPDFILSPSLLSSLSRSIVDETEGLNIDQLEQLRAACYDVIWRGRKDWSRDEMVRELDEIARDFVEEVKGQ